MNDASANGRGDSGVSLDWLRAPEWGLFVGILVVLAVIYVLEPRHNFFETYSQKTLIHQVALFGMLSIGAAVVIIAGGIDLSVGAVVALASVVVSKLITEWLPGARASGSPGPLPPTLIAAAIALTLLMGLAIGLLHASLINQLRLPPFIATLATMAGLRSLATIVSNNRSINVSFREFRFLGSDPWYTVPIFAVVALAASVGMLSALGGILFTGKSGQGQATMGVAYELYAITAAVVGGCSLAGGVGSIRGTVLGLILIQVVIKGTGLLPWGIDSTQVEGLVLGTVVVLAVAFNQHFRGRR
jgi:ribose/xylose/arabinose/galactoside ABC-type transport system permease subunit